jgi:hypothetical protein
MKTRFACLLAAAFLLAPAGAFAEICSLDNAPAATLLLPYFEVDLDNPNGQTTLFSVNNSSATAALVHVQVWSDLGVPTLGFEVYLTGYDVETINLRDVFDGMMPQTASAGQDPLDTLSPKGVLSQDINFASCNGILPLPPLPAAFVTHLRAVHTGKFSAVLNGCGGQDLGDGLARGYVTMDTVNNCVLKSPSDPGYFELSATDQNILWGDFIYVNPANNFADGGNLVRIEAFPNGFKPGDTTFYGRYVNGSGIDHREPLATTWASRFAVGGAFPSGTDLIVWHDSGLVDKPFACGTTPPGFPLLLAGEDIFDEQEQTTSIPLFPCGPAFCPTGPPLDAFPAEAGRVPVDSAAVPVPFAFGWLYLNLNPPGGQAGYVHQSWVGTVMKAQGRFSVGFGATPLDSACEPLFFVP